MAKSCCKKSTLDNFMCEREKLMPDWLNVIADEPDYSVMFTSRGTVGVDAGHYDGFNVCHYTGDDPAHIESCRMDLSETTGIEKDCWVIPRQTHSTVVRVIDGTPADLDFEGVDGVVTSLRGLAVGVSTADCIPLIMVDPVAGVIAAIHAGWRGAVGGIVEAGVDAMERLGADVSRIRTYFGPAICVDCFEVGEEVAVRFPEECIVRFSDGRRPHVDLPAYVRRELLRCGLSPENVGHFDNHLCTRCHPLRYFSARYSGVNSGRNFTFAVLK